MRKEEGGESSIPLKKWPSTLFLPSNCNAIFYNVFTSLSCTVKQN
jgi:hypothetical protein